MRWRDRLLGRRRLEHELDAELRDHLERHVADLVAAGVVPHEARRRAHLALGGIDQVKERCRDVRGTRWLEQLGQDVSYAARMLRKSPVFTLVAVLSLALGIGANTATFSLVNSLMLRTLPVRDPERLVLISRGSWTNPIWEEIRARQRQLADGAAAFSEESFDLAQGGETDPVDALWVSGGFFDLLGVRPVLGRAIAIEDDRHGGGDAGPVAVISHGFWQRRLGGAPDVLGRSVMLNRVPFTIVGVAPPGFYGPATGRRFDVYVPIGTAPLFDSQHPASRLTGRSFWWLNIILRLKSGQGLEDLTRAVNAVRPQIRAATQPEDWPPHMLQRYLSESFILVPAPGGPEGIREQYQRPLLVITAIVGLVLLIACANLANLLLARATARRGELTLRRALGASRGRIVRQLLTESLLLSVAGAALGVGLALWGSRFLVAQLSTPGDVVFVDLAMDWRVIGFTGASVVATALLFGIAPAYRASAIDPQTVLKDESRTLSGGRRRAADGFLIVAQVALSLVLLVAAGLFIRTLSGLSGRDLGFDSGRVLLVAMNARDDLQPRALTERFVRLAGTVARLPGVAAASVSAFSPVSGFEWNDRFDVPGAPQLPDRERDVFMNAVAPGWFTTYGTALLAGRDFADTDRAGAPTVIIVNEAFARRFLGGENPVGRTVRGPSLDDSSPPGTNQPMQIVGLVENAVYSSLREPVPPTVYLPMGQSPGPWASATLAVRASAGSPARLSREVATALTRADPALSLSFLPLSDQVGGELVRERLVAILAGFFGALALLLSAIGLYGVTWYAVGRRRTEIAVRMALGANGRAVTRLVLDRVLVLVLLGVVLGAALGAWASGFAASLLYGLEPRDPATFVTAASVLVATAAAAAWLPTRQATRIDPAEVLREG